MNIRKYKFGIAKDDAEAMWDFGGKNEVNFHFIKKIPLIEYADPIKNSLESKFFYEGMMSTETFLLLNLTVPVLPYK